MDSTQQLIQVNIKMDYSSFNVVNCGCDFAGLDPYSSGLFDLVHPSFINYLVVQEL